MRVAESVLWDTAPMLRSNWGWARSAKRISWSIGGWGMMSASWMAAHATSATGAGRSRPKPTDVETSGARWVRCLQCQGSGYIDEETLDRGRRSAAEREQARRREIRERHSTGTGSAGARPAGTGSARASPDSARLLPSWRRGSSAGAGPTGEQAQREQAQQAQGTGSAGRPSGSRLGLSEQAQRDRPSVSRLVREHATIRRTPLPRWKHARLMCRTQQAAVVQKQRPASGRAAQGGPVAEDAAGSSQG